MASSLPRGRGEWGYVIYRTVYTPDSDAVWSSILSKLDAYVHRSIWTNVHHISQNPSTISSNAHDTGAFNYASSTPQCALFKNIIITDRRKHNGESTEQVAAHFNDFLEAIPFSERRGINQQVCLIIDDEVLSWLKHAPIPRPQGRSSSEERVYIKAIDADWDPNECDDERDASFEGWGLVPISLLGRLYENLSRDEPLGALVSAHRSYAEKIFIYDG